MPLGAVAAGVRNGRQGGGSPAAQVGSMTIRFGAIPRGGCRQGGMRRTRGQLAQPELAVLSSVVRRASASPSGAVGIEVFNTPGTTWGEAGAEAQKVTMSSSGSRGRARR